MNALAFYRAALPACLTLWFCGCDSTSPTHHFDHPAHVERIDEHLALVTLTEKAAERIDLKTDAVAQGEDADTLVVPYSSLLYDAQGQTWVYVSPSERAFKRQQVQVDRIVGNDVILSEGPMVGTMVATVGVIEIYGTEFAVGH